MVAVGDEELQLEPFTLVALNLTTMTKICFYHDCWVASSWGNPGSVSYSESQKLKVGFVILKTVNRGRVQPLDLALWLLLHERSHWLARDDSGSTECWKRNSDHSELFHIISSFQAMLQKIFLVLINCKFFMILYCSNCLLYNMLFTFCTMDVSSLLIKKIIDDHSMWIKTYCITWHKCKPN